MGTAVSASRLRIGLPLALFVTLVATGARAAPAGLPGRVAQKAPPQNLAADQDPPAPASSADILKLGDSLLDDVNLTTKPRDAGPVADAAPPPKVTPAPAVTVDAAVPPPPPPAVVEPPKPPPPPPPSGFGPAARQARIDSGANLAMRGAEDSPLTKLGVPPEAVPAVATVITVGGMSFWPFLMKTLAGLLKSISATFLKNRAKKKIKVDENPVEYDLLGFRVRPRELASLLFGALCYGLAVAYAFMGRKVTSQYLASQESLVVMIALARASVRFFFERQYKLVTQYKFWPGGGLLCLGSAVLGNTLSTVGFEVEAASKSPEATARAAKLKVALIATALWLAIVFAWANIVGPTKLLQAARVATSGMALGEILPIAPMAGLKIYKWNSTIWGALFVLVIASFFLMNFYL